MEPLETLLKGLARNAVRLSIGDGDGTEVGRFGGSPDVPPGFEWPCFETDTIFDDTVKPRPLSFLAQFDCAALAPLDGEGLLPHEGVRSFFYELGSQRWGFDPKDAGCARVYWFPDKAALTPRELPEDMEEDWRLPSLAIHGRQSVEYPSSEEFPLSFLKSILGTANGGWTALNRVRNGLRGYAEEPSPYHRLLGWPDIIQNGIAQQCELVRRGYYLGGSGDIPQEVLDETDRTALEDWRLLFQLDSFRAGGFELMFGDCGSVYFYIRKEDLASRRFDQVWLVLQCC